MNDPTDDELFDYAKYDPRITRRNKKNVDFAVFIFLVNRTAVDRRFLCKKERDRGQGKSEKKNFQTKRSKTNEMRVLVLA